jgi:predicted transposase YbfD/YdcC
VLVQLKGNQATLLTYIEKYATTYTAAGQHQERDIGKRNRDERRTTTVWNMEENALAAEWTQIKCIIRVDRKTGCFDTRLKNWRERCETAWYICTKPLTAMVAAKAIRDHWRIENTLHYVRDVTFGEDASRIRKHPNSFAQLRTFAFNSLRNAGFENMNEARQMMAWGLDTLKNLFK